MAPVASTSAMLIPLTVRLVSSAAVCAPGTVFTGASFTAVPVITLLPVTAGATPSDTDVAMVKLELKFAAGLKVTAASRALTLATAPLAAHTPVPAL